MIISFGFAKGTSCIRCWIVYLKVDHIVVTHVDHQKIVVSHSLVSIVITLIETLPN
jgi:hypothetical protein